MLPVIGPRRTRRKAPAGLLFLHTMPQEPTVKRAVSFFDGQNLFRHAKNAFGHHALISTWFWSGSFPIIGNLPPPCGRKKITVSRARETPIPDHHIDCRKTK